MCLCHWVFRTLEPVQLDRSMYFALAGSVLLGARWVLRLATHSAFALPLLSSPSLLSCSVHPITSSLLPRTFGRVFAGGLDTLDQPTVVTTPMKRATSPPSLSGLDIPPQGAGPGARSGVPGAVRRLSVGQQVPMSPVRTGPGGEGEPLAMPAHVSERGAVLCAVYGWGRRFAPVHVWWLHLREDRKS